MSADTLENTTNENSAKIPRASDNDYTAEIIGRRQQFIEEKSGVQLNHTKHFSFDPESMEGNCEHVFGVSQLPIGLAGPLLVNGEHAQGEFYVPMATVEGTLVASYNRGMRLLAECGGVRATVVDEAMQRSPVFTFPDALAARQFGRWVVDNMNGIRAAAEATTRSGRLRDIMQFAIGPLRYLRFNFTRW